MWYTRVRRKLPGVYTVKVCVSARVSCAGSIDTCGAFLVVGVRFLVCAGLDVSFLSPTCEETGCADGYKWMECGV